ncbi:helix-turn-helix domain-containing protein [Streptomyces sp. NPDC091266]|uniref:helix-turn-helix domain-containing protein n=1 Tax=Streptomyces sp. NPDC091266 TaxID=3365978 RepID=UPI0037FED45A
MTSSQPVQDNRVSTVLGRRLGRELHRLRTVAGLTQGEAARSLSASTGKIAKMESGWVPMRDPDVRTLCAVFGVVDDPLLVGGLLELARLDRERRKAKGWWSEFPLAGAMKEYVALESAATAIKAWQLAFVPGLLQTPGYVSALKPDEHFVSMRVNRQRRLAEEPLLDLRVVISEAGLRTLVGGADVMREQLRHLCSMGERPNVAIQVLPFSAGAQLGMDCAFNVMSFAEPGAMDVVYMENLHTELWIEGGKDASQYDGLFETIAERSLGEADSRAFISQLVKEL